MAELIRTIGLKKHFPVEDGFLHAVDGLDISINSGSTFGVVGESGCGKSTLGRVIIRLLEATSGQVLFGGKDLLQCKKDELKRLRREMQIIFQDPYSSLNPRLSVYEIIAEPLLNHDRLGRDALNRRVTQLMNMVGLAERFINSYPHEMDGGRRQRVGVARALALNPRFIVCDEPVSALDVSIQAQILNLLMDLQEELDLTYMFITHDLSVVKHISNEIAVMYLGQCVERAPSQALFNNPLHPYTKALLSAIPVPKLSSRYEERNIIRGEVSNPINPAPGCRFAARCDFRKDACEGRDIPLRHIGDDHYVACTLHSDTSAQA